MATSSFGCTVCLCMNLPYRESKKLQASCEPDLSIYFFQTPAFWWGGFTKPVIFTSDTVLKLYLLVLIWHGYLAIALDLTLIPCVSSCRILRLNQNFSKIPSSVKCLTMISINSKDTCKYLLSINTLSISALVLCVGGYRWK